MALSDADKTRTRYHLGYLASSFAGSFQLGIPRPTQTVFLLEQAMNLITDPLAIDRVVELLDTMDCIEAKLKGAADQVGVSQLGDLKLHPLADKGELGTDSLDKEYARWGSRLADTLGVPFYPFSRRYQKRGPGSVVNVRSS